MAMIDKTIFVEKAEIKGDILDLGEFKAKLLPNMLKAITTPAIRNKKDISFKTMWEERTNCYARLSSENYLRSITIIVGRRHYSYFPDRIIVDREICDIKHEIIAMGKK